jgi:predicted nucleotidyltransferase
MRNKHWLRVQIEQADARRLVRVLRGQADYLTALILAAERRGDTESAQYLDVLRTRNTVERVCQALDEADRLTNLQENPT